jgi:hypothetical protein
VAKAKSVDATWSDVKAEIAKLDTRQLVSLLVDLYRFSKENQAFLNARFAVVADPLGPYKRTIAECMYPDVYKNKPVRISKAKKAISDYSKAVGDSLGEAELMTFFAEQGNAFTVDFGDIDEEFYDALLRMYWRAIEKILSLPEGQRGEFKVRLKTIMTSSADIGWGYHDALREEYYSAFPDDEEPPNQ